MPTRETPTFRVGDRVIGVKEYDGNEDIVGTLGTIRAVEGSGSYAVQYDDPIEGGHGCGIGIPNGYGWHTRGSCLALYQPPAPVEVQMSYDEVMM